MLHQLILLTAESVILFMERSTTLHLCQQKDFIGCTPDKLVCIYIKWLTYLSLGVNHLH